jgi:hypothetical protein
MGSALERILGLAEGAFGVVERAFWVTAPSGEPSQLPESSRHRTTQRFDVLEVLELTGGLSWIVTNGRNSATCDSAEFAERVRVALG